jgi:Rho family protein
VLDGNEELNPSIGTYLNDKVGERAKELFFNRPLLSDVTFRVGDKIIYAHKAILRQALLLLSLE